jgi:hypothetical protein
VDAERFGALRTRARNNVRRVLREQFTKTAPISVHTLPQPMVDMACMLDSDTPEGTVRSLMGLGTQSVGLVRAESVQTRSGGRERPQYKYASEV